jgi:hypothetical protein
VSRQAQGDDRAGAHDRGAVIDPIPVVVID